MKGLARIATVLTAAVTLAQPVQGQSQPDSLAAPDSALVIEGVRVSARPQPEIPAYSPLLIRTARNPHITEITEGNPTILEATPKLGVLLYNHLVSESVERSIAEHPLVIPPTIDYDFKNVVAGAHIARRPIRASSFAKGSDLIVQQSPSVQPGMQTRTDVLQASSIAAGINSETVDAGVEIILHHPELLEGQINALDPFMSGRTINGVINVGDALAIHAAHSDLTLNNKTFVSHPVWGTTKQSLVSATARQHAGPLTFGLDGTWQQGVIGSGEEVTPYRSEHNNRENQTFEAYFDRGVERVDLTASIRHEGSLLDATISRLTKTRWDEREFTVEQPSTSSDQVIITQEEPEQGQLSRDVFTLRARQALATRNGLVQIGGTIDFIDHDATRGSFDILLAREVGNARGTIELVYLQDPQANPLRDRHLQSLTADSIYTKKTQYAEIKLEVGGEENQFVGAIRKTQSHMELMRGTIEGESISLAYTMRAGDWKFSTTGVLRNLHLVQQDGRSRLAPLTPEAEIRGLARYERGSFFTEASYMGSTNIWFPNTLSRFSNIEGRHIVGVSVGTQFGPFTVGADLINPLDLIPGVNNDLTKWTPETITPDSQPERTPYPTLLLLNIGAYLGG